MSLKFSFEARRLAVRQPTRARSWLLRISGITDKTKKLSLLHATTQQG